MIPFKRMGLFVLGIGLMGSVYATNQPFESMLTPGARLIAGDLSKDEFFIIGADDQNPRQSFTKNIHKENPFVTKIHLAASRMTRHSAVYQISSVRQVALNKLIFKHFAVKHSSQHYHETMYQVAKVHAKKSSHLAMHQSHRLSKLKLQALMKPHAVFAEEHPVMKLKKHKVLAHAEQAQKSIHPKYISIVI